MSTTLRATRRQVVQALALGSAAVAMRPAMAAIGAGGAAEAAASPAPAPVANAPVVSFFMDQPYLDMTGTAQPYVPPLGLRGADSH